MHTFTNDAMPYGPDISRPGVPTSEGITTVNPDETTSLAKAATFGVMPGNLVDHDHTGPDATPVHVRGCDLRQ